MILTFNVVKKDYQLCNLNDLVSIIWAGDFLECDCGDGYLRVEHPFADAVLVYESPDGLKDFLTLSYPTKMEDIKAFIEEHNKTNREAVKEYMREEIEAGLE